MVRESISNLREKSADELEDLVVVIWQLIVQKSLHFANALVSLKSCNDSNFQVTFKSKPRIFSSIQTLHA